MGGTLRGLKQGQSGKGNKFNFKAFVFLLQLLNTLKELEMITRMSLDIKDKKIIKTIIQFIAVYMVNLLIGVKRATKKLLHYFSVFGSLPFTSKNISVTTINCVATLESGIIRTKINTRCFTPLVIASFTTSLFGSKLGGGNFNRNLAY